MLNDKRGAAINKITALKLRTNLTLCEMWMSEWMSVFVYVVYVASMSITKCE